MAEDLKQILNNEEILNKVVKEVFEKVNTDKSGEINKKQFEDMMNEISNDLGYELPPKNEVNDVFEYLDSKKQGTLSFDDFKVLIRDVIKNMINQKS